MEDPTENSIAQASWASRRHESINFEGNFPNVPNTFEAESWSLYHDMDWQDAIEKCKLWLFDQPFSSGPCMLGSSLAAIALEDYSTTEWFARRGLLANQSEFILWNNLAFALINLGKMDEVKATLARASRAQKSLRDESVLLATQGLFEFRSGKLERGRSLYSNARAKASTIHGEDARRVFAMASTYYVIEEASHGVLDTQSLLSETIEIVRKLSDPFFRVLEQRLNKLRPSERYPQVPEPTI